MIDLAKELEMDHELVSQNPESKNIYYAAGQASSHACWTCARNTNRVEAVSEKWPGFSGWQAAGVDGFLYSTAP